MKVNIPGAREGMYMSMDSLMTDVRPISVQGDYALEARGLWRIKGDFMGRSVRIACTFGQGQSAYYRI